MQANIGTVSNTFSDLLGNALFGSFFNRMKLLIMLFAETASQSIQADAGNVWLVKEGSLHLAVILNRPKDLLGRLVLHCGDGLNAEVVRTRNPVVSDNVQKDPRSAVPEVARREGLVSYLGCPIIIGDTCIGVMSFFRKNSRKFTDAEILALSSISSLLGLAIHHCSLSSDSFAHWRSCMQQIGNWSLTKQQAGNGSQAGRGTPLWVLGETPPKGIHPTTLARIKQALLSSPTPLTCEQVARQLDISPVTARRYLTYLHDTGSITREVNYRVVGRPRYSYGLAWHQTQSPT